MNAGLFVGAADWLALILIVGALAAALAAALSRSLFAMILALAICGTSAAGAALAHGDDHAGLGQALLSAAIAPLLLMAVLLLTTRAAKTRRKRAPWATIGLGGASAALMSWPVVQFAGASRPIMAALAPIAPGLAMLLFVAAMAALGALGYGERGLFAHSRSDDGTGAP